ncbi:MAG: DUF1819 family protein [Peptococcaceae bacterium]|nr:DUF1819 family protein [Peptococcaceae bacterium]
MLEYRSTLKTRAFLYLELKKAASLSLQGFSAKDIIGKSVSENVFAMNTESRKREIAVTLTERLAVLDSYLLDKLVYGNLSTSRHIALYTILKTDRLFFEFMYEVFRDKLVFFDTVIMPKDFAAFFLRKVEQSDVVASWADYTYYKLEQVYRKVLIESGLAEKKTRSVIISRAGMEADLVQHFEAIGDQVYVKTLVGVV